MIEIPEWMEGTEIEIELSGADEAAAMSLREVFSDEKDDVIFSHAFGGADAVIIVTVLGKAVFEKLMDYRAKMRTFTPKTTVKIDKTSITMTGFERGDVEALLASAAFQSAIRASRGK